MRPLVASLVFVGLALGLDVAEAQVAQDFAACPKDLVVCDATRDDCCVRPFDPIGTDRAIIIPMDRCHQVVAAGGTLSPPTAAAAWCSDPGPFTSNDNGMYEAYGLVFRLMQRRIPVYWVINPTKDPPALTAHENLNGQTYTERDVDTWLLAADTSPPLPGFGLESCTGQCVPPVRLLDPATLTPSASWTYSRRQFPVRGGAFVIAPEDRARFNEFWQKQGEFAGLAGNPNFDFSKVDLYELTSGARAVYQDFRHPAPYPSDNGAPVAVRIDREPPRLARLAPAGVSETWLRLVRLHVAADYPACLTGTFTPADAVYCDVTKEDIGNNALISGDFDLTWIDNWSSPAPCASVAEEQQIDRLLEFMRHDPLVRAAGHAMLMERIVDVVERCRGRQLQGVSADIGLLADGQPSTEPYILRRPQSLFMQWGDLPTEFSEGAITHWRYFGGGATGYDPAHLDPVTGTLVRLVTEDRAAVGNTLCSQHRSTPACDIFALSPNADYWDVASYIHVNDDPANGIAFYMGGNAIMNGPSQLRMVLNALIALPLASVP